jgi:hypothetical protein
MVQFLFRVLNAYCENLTLKKFFYFWFTRFIWVNLYFLGAVDAFIFTLINYKLLNKFIVPLAALLVGNMIYDFHFFARVWCAIKWWWRFFWGVKFDNFGETGPGQLTVNASFVNPMFALTSLRKKNYCFFFYTQYYIKITPNRNIFIEIFYHLM